MAKYAYKSSEVKNKTEINRINQINKWFYRLAKEDNMTNEGNGLWKDSCLLAEWFDTNYFETNEIREPFTFVYSIQFSGSRRLKNS